MTNFLDIPTLSHAEEQPTAASRSTHNSVEVVTFGCRLNAYESEAIQARAGADGLTNAVIFNTCAVTAEAVRQARQAIRKARRERPDARVIVTGCAAQIEPGTFADMAEVDVVLGNADKSAPGAYLDRPEAPRVRVNDIMSVRETAGHLVGGQLIGGLDGRARAYVEVQNGCDHRCTFCVIPYGRGNSRSAAAGAVVEQVRRLAEAGYGEVVLTGVDITSWGQDLPGGLTLGQLVAQNPQASFQNCHAPSPSSIDAAEIDADLMRCLAEEPRLMPHLHLSLQAGDDMILKRMKRRHSRADALRLIAGVRAVRPDTAFGADLIAGFPTETDEMFENTLALVEDAGLAYLHVFPFSPRGGTPAARMPQLARSVVKASRCAVEGGFRASRTIKPPRSSDRSSGQRDRRTRRAGPGGGLHRGGRLRVLASRASIRQLADRWTRRGEGAWAK